MRNKKIERPEVLEYLKTTRTLIRQLKQFGALKISEYDKEQIDKGLMKLRAQIDDYLKDGERS